MSANTNGHVNGKANGTAKGEPFASREREPLELLTEWIARELRKPKIERFELVQRGVRGDLRVVQDWERIDHGDDPAGLAMEIYQRATDEAANGEGTAKFAAQSQPGGIFCSFPVPFRMQAGPAGSDGATVEAALSMAIGHVRSLEHVTGKFALALFQGSIEERSLMARVSAGREEETTKRYDKLQGHYEKELDRVNGLVEKLLDERVQYMEMYVALATKNAEDEADAKREERRAQMREKLYNDALKPILPVIGAKILAGVRGLGAPGPKPEAKPDDKPAADGKSADEIKAEAAKVEAKPVTDEQASALWALFGKLEPEDFRKMVEVLDPAKRALFFRVIDVFTGGAT